MEINLATRLETEIEEALDGWQFDHADALAEEYQRAATEASDRFRAAWLAVQVALQAGRLQSARTRLEHLPALPTGQPPALLCRICLARAEVAVRLGYREEARTFLAEADPFHRERARNPLLQLRYLRIRLMLGEVETCGSAIATLREMLQVSDDQVHLVLLSTEEGRAWNARGNLEQARRCYSEALRLGKKLRPDPVWFDALLQHSACDHLLGQLQPALDGFEEVMAGSPAPLQVMEARLRRVLVLLDFNQVSRARAECDAIERAWSQQFTTEELQPLMAMVRGHLGLMDAANSGETAAFRHLLAGDLERAMELYQQAHQVAVGPERSARLAVVLGQIALALRNYPEATRWLLRAETLGRQYQLPEVLWRALQGRGQLIAETEGDEERARALLEEAVQVSEKQAESLRFRMDAAGYGLHRRDILTNLLRSACRRGDVESAFRYLELQRGRLLLDLYQASQVPLLQDDPRLAQIDAWLDEIEKAPPPPTPEESEAVHHRRTQLLQSRDRLLEEFLRDRSRTTKSRLPCNADLNDLHRVLKPNTCVVMAVALPGEVFFLVISAGENPYLVSVGERTEAMLADIRALRQCLDQQLEKYRRGLRLQENDRQQLDFCLDQLGQGPLGEVLAACLHRRVTTSRRIIWIPHGEFHGLPVHALRRAKRYLIEFGEFVVNFSSGQVVLQAQTRSRRHWLGRALIVAESPTVLPGAQREGQGVGATFLRTRYLQGDQATRNQLRASWGRGVIAHFACHAYFEERNPLSSSIGLPSGEQLRAVELLGEPVQGLPLVTLSACRSASVAPLMGQEVFGLVSGLLGAGVRAVVAGLWPVADRETVALMWSFYRHRLLEEIPTALALAQREALVGAGSSPLFWAAFAFFGDPYSLPAPGCFTRWWAQRRQAWHAARFPLAQAFPLGD